MLSCIYLVGSLFLMKTDYERVYNFHHYGEFYVTNGQLLIRNSAEHERFDLPDHLRSASPVEVINECVEQAEIRARHTAQTSDID